MSVVPTSLNDGIEIPNNKLNIDILLCNFKLLQKQGDEMVRVFEYMTKEIIMVSAESTVLEVIDVMRDNGIGAVLIEGNGRIEGIFTDKDVRNKIVFNDIEPGELIRDYMTPDVVMVSPDDLYTVVIELMQANRIRHVPVMEDGNVIGMVSLGDLLSHYHESLESFLEETVAALSSSVEMRDPYTAGHQRRVSLLASAIAIDLELPEKQISGVRLAAIIHDIGKIYVPAEILSKPGKLSDTEMALIRDHAKVGYEILKGIEFPWPIATIVGQHHERMDGKGYPNGVSGKKLLIESQIVGVADVVESMASHRPYRPSLGIDKALEEIIREKGQAHRGEIVDVCVNLFKKKKFTFE